MIFKNVFILLSFLYLLLPSIAKTEQGTIGRSLDHRHHVMVLVLEIPLFSKPNTSSPILQYKRKGEILYVKENISDGAMWRPNYELVQYFEQESYDNYIRELQQTEYVKKRSGEINKTNIDIQQEGFFTTLDQIGREAYIPKVFVKPLYHDGRELIETVNRFDHDPTDYRVPEPLGPSFPFVEERNLTFHTHWGYSPGDQNRVDYGLTPLTEDYQGQSVVQIGVGKKLSFDKDRRWSFGFMGEASWQKSFIKLADNHFAEERMQKYGFAPFMSYEVFRGDKLTAEILSGIMVYPWVSFKSFETRSGSSTVSRIFHAYQTSPFISGYLYSPPFLESQRIGVGAQISLPLTAGIKQTYSDIVSESDLSYRIRPIADFSLSLALRGQF